MAETAAGELAAYLDGRQVSILILSGVARGTEFAVDQCRVTLGRGPGVDLSFDDPRMVREHAAIEFVDGSFGIRALSPEAGVQLNGGSIDCGDLKHGDRFLLGEHSFQFVIQNRRSKG